MIRFLVTLDLWIRKAFAAFCMIALFLMVAFTIYTVFMRYVFEDPPVWGDLLTVLSNIWLVFIVLALTVRDKDHIALSIGEPRHPSPPFVIDSLIAHLHQLSPSSIPCCWLRARLPHCSSSSYARSTAKLTQNRRSSTRQLNKALQPS